MQGSRGRRRGSVFPLRLTDAERAEVEAHIAAGGGPRSIGPWLLWAALRRGPGNTSPANALELGYYPLEQSAAAPVMPALRAGAGNTSPRLVLDLCGGTGAWSRPYVEAGYDVRVVTLPADDVRDYTPPPGVHGILAAPPCTEFSVAKTTGERDLLTGLETVTACLRVVALARPRWWALENPGSGLLRRWLGTPRDVWQPCDFGDPWTKLTALWGDFTLPARSYVRPQGGMPGSNAVEHAITPPGFAAAFFAANP